jgi:hypothetical protein
MALKDEITTPSPIGMRVEAWAGRRAGESGEITRVDGLHYLYIRFDGYDSEVLYARRDVMRVTTPRRHAKCWNCCQPATHTLTREGCNTLHACDNCTRIDVAEAESRGWTITKTVEEIAHGAAQDPHPLG